MEREIIVKFMVDENRLNQVNEEGSFFDKVSDELGWLAQSGMRWTNIEVKGDKDD